MTRTLALLLTLAMPLSAQDAKKKKKPADFQAEFQGRVDAAIRKGVAYLRTVGRGGDEDELVFLALIHAGRDMMAEQDPLFQAHLKQALEGELGGALVRTYRVSLTAMCLEEIDRVKYQRRIWQCGQFLVDNQCPNGEWTYGQPIPFINDIPAGKPVKKDVATGDAPRSRTVDFAKVPAKPKVVQTMKVTKHRDGPATGGDSSNSQYAALGLRACHDAGIIIPEETIRKAHRWWQRTAEGETTETSSGKPKPRSWGYGGPMATGSDGCGAMTVGAIGALAIYDYILDNDGGKKKSWTGDPAVQGGLAWLAQKFRTSDNAGTCDAIAAQRHILYYYLYAVERVGMLCGTETFGQHSWYRPGADELLKNQNADGSWFTGVEGEHCNVVRDTCFSILFLRRATRSLDVASVDRFQPERK